MTLKKKKIIILSYFLAYNRTTLKFASIINFLSFITFFNKGNECISLGLFRIRGTFFILLFTVLITLTQKTLWFVNVLPFNVLCSVWIGQQYDNRNIPSSSSYSHISPFSSLFWLRISFNKNFFSSLNAFSYNFFIKQRRICCLVRIIDDFRAQNTANEKVIQSIITCHT